MKIIIFLDIDGVLYTSKYNKYLLDNNLKDRDDCGYIFDVECVKNLNFLNSKLDFDVVVTSTWRSKGLDYLKTLFDDRNIDVNIVGMTPLGTIDKLYFSRCDEVKDYEYIKNYEKIIVIDDNFGDCDQDFDIYKTTMKDGLTKNIVEKIIKKYE